MITAMPGSTVSASLTLGTTGLVGTLAIQVVDAGQQTVAVARTTAGINEFPTGSGVYGASIVAPLAPGLYAVIWDTAGGSPLTPMNSHYDTLTVIITDPTTAGGWSWDPASGWVLNGDEGDGSGVNISTGSPGSNPVPDAAYVVSASKLTWSDYGYSSNDGPGGIQELVDRAESTFWRITGQTLDQIDAQDAPLVRRVIQGLTEQIAMASSSDTLDTMADWDLIQSFSAGSYSETRRSADDMFKSRMLNAVPWISDALWSMLTPERYEHYLQFFTGVNTPAWQAGDVYWAEGDTMANIEGPSPGHWWGA